MKQAKTHIGVALVTAAVSVLTTLEAGALAGGGPCVDFDSALGPVRPLHQAGQPPLPLGEIGWGGEDVPLPARSCRVVDADRTDGAIAVPGEIAANQVLLVRFERVP